MNNLAPACLSSAAPPHAIIVRRQASLVNPVLRARIIIAVLIGVVQARQNIRDPTGANN